MTQSLLRAPGSALGAALFAYLLLAPPAALADPLGDFRQAWREGKTSHQLRIDNDSLLLNKDDGFYSSGLEFGQKFVLAGGDRERSAGWRIGQQLYTASDIKLAPAQIARRDHPYAGWLYGGVYSEVWHADGSGHRIGLDLGCLGPCAGGRWTQTTLHRMLDQPEPRGWAAQVRNEFGVLAYGEWVPLRWQPASWMALRPILHGRFGNIHTDAGVALDARAGRLAALPSQPALYGFVRLDARAVGHNASLEGGYFSKNNPHTVKPRRLVREIALGLAWKHASFASTLALVRRSSEIQELRSGAQNFVRLELAYTP